MITLQQQANNLINNMSEEKLLSVIPYLQYVYKMPSKKISDKNFQKKINIDDYAGSAKDVLGKNVDIDNYIKEIRADERF